MPVSILDHRGSVLKTIHTDAHDEDRLVEVTTQDMDPVLELVRYMQDTHVEIDGLRPVAFIPEEVVERMMRDGSWNDPAAVRRWANDPSNDCFRITKGRV
jgi:hypothetical protein